MNIVFVSLEQSGHNISKNIIQEILKYKTNHKLFTFGQPKKVSNILEISKININPIMGISQILKNFLYLLKLRNHLFNQSKKYKADMIFFIDSFDFSKFFFKKYNNFKICQVVGPSVFIWRQGKAKFINDNFQKIFSIFLIEKKYYKKSKYSYIGHPSSIKNITRKKKFKKITNLGIFLGSRDQEFFNNLNTLSDFLLTNIKYKIFLFTLPKYKKYLKNKLPNNNISVILNDNSYYKYISKLDFALACSGTVHIELSLSKIPHLIFYRTSLLNYIFFKLFINSKYLSLLNIFSKKLIIKEFLQSDFKKENIENYLFNINNEHSLKLLSNSIHKNILKFNINYFSVRPIIDYLKRFS